MTNMIINCLVNTIMLPPSFRDAPIRCAAANLNKQNSSGLAQISVWVFLEIPGEIIIDLLTLNCDIC